MRPESTSNFKLDPNAIAIADSRQPLNVKDGSDRQLASNRVSAEAVKLEELRFSKNK
ncbi:MAG: hypothetical protein MUE44_29130 [Oscillatoriaceae cyanobacterium Prado104]|jgi:hypothetical protein|nr:hypothetical protein [Oscillatoriaceae cyanobacterium Prado104]